MSTHEASTKVDECRQGAERQASDHDNEKDLCSGDTSGEVSISDERNSLEKEDAEMKEKNEKELERDKEDKYADENQAGGENNQGKDEMNNMTEEDEKNMGEDGQKHGKVEEDKVLEDAGQRVISPITLEIGEVITAPSSYPFSASSDDESDDKQDRDIQQISENIQKNVEVYTCDKNDVVEDVHEKYHDISPRMQIDPINEYQQHEETRGKFEYDVKGNEQFEASVENMDKYNDNEDEDEYISSVSENGDEETCVSDTHGDICDAYNSRKHLMTNYSHISQSNPEFLPQHEKHKETEQYKIREQLSDYHEGTESTTKDTIIPDSKLLEKISSYKFKSQMPKFSTKVNSFKHSGHVPASYPSSTLRWTHCDSQPDYSQDDFTSDLVTHVKVSKHFATFGCIYIFLNLA